MKFYLMFLMLLIIVMLLWMLLEIDIEKRVFGLLLKNKSFRLLENFRQLVLMVEEVIIWGLQNLCLRVILLNIRIKLNHIVIIGY